MENPNERIKDLIIRYLKGTLSVPEQLELQAWVNLSPDHRQLLEHLSDPDRLREEVKEYAEAWPNTWDKVEAGIRTAPPVIRPVRRIRPYIAAASLLIIIITSYFWLTSQHASSEARPATVPVAAVRDVAPGGDKATLTLADGSIVTLENAANGSLAKQGSAQVSKDKNSLSYTVAAAEQATTVIYNTLTTPRAGQFQVVLPDGTKVWLNNASSLKYPTSFTGPNREVELSGEGYFEVAKNTTQPFLVRIPNATIHVLGTSFNIMAYTDEPVVRTTLLTGRVSIASGARQSVLSPGQQGVLDHKGTITVEKDVDAEEVIAWQRGFFNFKGARLSDVLRQLARWYDVEVEYTITPPSDYTSDGEIGRNLNLATILKHLERKDVHFKIEGKRLIVSD